MQHKLFHLNTPNRKHIYISHARAVCKHLIWERSATCGAGCYLRVYEIKLQGSVGMCEYLRGVYRGQGNNGICEYLKREATGEHWYLRGSERKLQGNTGICEDLWEATGEHWDLRGSERRLRGRTREVTGRRRWGIGYLNPFLRPPGPLHLTPLGASMKQHYKPTNNK
jgi:hypothetical protein